MLRDAPVRSAVETVHTQVWFGPERRPLFGWLSRPADGLAHGGVVLCPPMGDDGRATHRTFRRLAEELAAAGFVALRFDYDGTGDSAGLRADPARVAHWLSSVEAARQYLLHLGAPGVSAVGMRLGATLAVVQASRGEQFRSLVCWDPCLSGRTFLREGEALYRLGEPDLPRPRDDLHHTPGFHYDVATAQSLRTLKIDEIPADRQVAERVLLLAREDRPVAKGVPRGLARVTETLDRGVARGQAELVDVFPDLSVVPETTLAEVVTWLTAGAGDTPRVPVTVPAEETAALVGSAPEDAAPVRERVVRLGGSQLVGVVSEPRDLERRRARRPVPWVVLVNVAVETHVGPGRCWVEWARGWAARGYRVLRLDQSGVGDSPTPPSGAADLPFAPEWIDDLRDVVDELASDGSRVGIVGLCSGSYSALETALWRPVDAVFAINPRLTIYQAAKGTPAFTDRRRAAVIPYRPVAALARRRRILAGGMWRIYRELAVWHAPLLVLWRVWRRGTALEVVACRDDAQHFTEVYAVRPLLWWMRRSSRFRFTADDTVDHSLLSRPAQVVGHERATAFLARHLPLGGGS